MKQRRDAIEQFNAGGRADLAAKEEAEIAILDTYLPPAVTADELNGAITQAIADTGASGPKDMGKVMKAVLAALAGKTVDGRASGGEESCPDPYHRLVTPELRNHWQPVKHFSVPLRLYPLKA